MHIICSIQTQTNYFRQSATSPCEDILPKLDLRSIDEVHAEEVDVGCDGFPYDQDLYSKKIRTSPIPNSIIRHNSPNGSPNSLEVDRYSQESLNLDDFDQVQTVRNYQRNLEKYFIYRIIFIGHQFLQILVLSRMNQSLVHHQLVEM